MLSLLRVLFVVALVFLPTQIQAQDLIGLGAPRATFINRFGPPVSSVADRMFEDFKKCPGKTAMAEWSVMFADDKAIAITRNSCPPGVHEPSTANSEAKLLFPSDAVAGKQFLTEYGWKARAYHSARLAKQLPAENFYDCGGKPVRRGTFFYLLSPERQSWMLGTGLCP